MGLRFPPDLILNKVFAVFDYFRVLSGDWVMLVPVCRTSGGRAAYRYWLRYVAHLLLQERWEEWLSPCAVMLYHHTLWRVCELERRSLILTETTLRRGYLALRRCLILLNARLHRLPRVFASRHQVSPASQSGCCGEDAGEDEEYDPDDGNSCLWPSLRLAPHPPRDGDCDCPPGCCESSSPDVDSSALEELAELL